MNSLDDLIAHYESLASVLKQAKQDAQASDDKLSALRQTLLDIDNLIDEENL